MTRGKTQNPEKREKKTERKQEVKRAKSDETRQGLDKMKLENMKEDLDPKKKVPKLIQKFLADYKHLSKEERKERMAEIGALGALALILPEKEEEPEKVPEKTKPEEEKKPRRRRRKRKKKEKKDESEKEKDEKSEESEVKEKPKTDAEKIVATAESYVGTDRFTKDFEENEMLQGGVLGCAWVATSILVDVGILDKVVPGTYTAEDALKKKGWKEAPRSEAEPGDVVIWEKIGQKVEMTPDGPEYIGGHRHIGIVTGYDEAISNSSRLKRPVKHKIDKPQRGVEMILKPPKAEKRRVPILSKEERERFEKGTLTEGIEAAFPNVTVQEEIQELNTGSSKYEGLDGTYEITGIEPPEGYTRRGTNKIPASTLKKIVKITHALRSDKRMPMYTGIVLNVDGIEVMMVKEQHIHSMGKYGEEGLSDYYYKPHTGVAYLPKEKGEGEIKIAA
jgi:hypothetical protein